MIMLLAVGLILAAGTAAVLLRGEPRYADRAYGALLVSGSGLGLAYAIGVLATGAVPAFDSGAAPGKLFAFGIDPLSAWFIIPVLGGGASAGVFGLGYLAPERSHRSVAGTHALFALLLAALVGVVTARAMVPFLAAWEVMALSAYLLVMFDHGRTEVRRAGFIYVALTHLSTLALIGMFAALGASSGRSFEELGLSNRLPGMARNLALVLALVGFGIKAGVVPLHFWLPGAHAAAPSHVSAVLSGVMLKVGIYGLLRVLSLIGAPPAWFGWILFGAGLASGVLGVLWALGQHELKRLLAYHSVENIGIILLGMGVGALGLSYGAPTVAVLGFTGALLHTLNHALFKSLLFLGAGTVFRVTGTRMIDELGGLLRVLPWTAVAFGVGSVAIVGLPPLNGFVSEWVVFRGMFAAGMSQGALRFAVVGAAGLGLIGALALACFTKLDGVAFLGSPRRVAAGPLPRCDPGATMLAPMLTLAGSCVLIGLFPGLVLNPARLIAIGITGGMPGDSAAYGEWSVDAGRITVLGLGVIALATAIVLFRRVLARSAEPSLAPTWGCAAAVASPRMQYTASSYAAPLLAGFGRIAGIREQRESESYHSHPVDPVLDEVALPVWGLLDRASERLRGIQGGRLRWYLLSVVFTLLALLYYLTTAGQEP